MTLKTWNCVKHVLPNETCSAYLYDNTEELSACFLVHQIWAPRWCNYFHKRFISDKYVSVEWWF